MPDNETKVITIANVETKMFDSGGTQYKIKSTDGQTFKFYDKKKAGGNTVAYQQFKDMELRVGSTVSVWYKTEEKEYNGKPYTDRMIASFREAAGKPVETPPPAKFEATEAKDDKFWDKKAYKQCLWNYWLEKVAIQDQQDWMTEVWQVFNQIEKDADKRFSTGWAKAEAVFGDDEYQGE